MCTEFLPLLYPVFSLQKKIDELKCENDSLSEKLKLEEQKQVAKEKANLVSLDLQKVMQTSRSCKPGFI